jgi:superfamily I DNA/RNA helicase
MEAVELARQIASTLHARAVYEGDDPWCPFEFAIAEARRRDIDVEAAAQGAAILNSGRATFLASERLILYEDVGSKFDRAFLVAHEIGHVVLGDDPTDLATLDIDPTRSAEASPIGLDRVVGYGGRQRREVQMDLFARELLLPRNVARRLHVEEGMTATAIAERLGAPFAVVAQQLLDALLLPPIGPKGANEETQTPLNEKQAIAAAHRGKPYLLGAGPGTGKTRTLVARVEGLLREGVDPRRILMLTFSNKAASEMAERLATKQRGAAAAMWIGTFHAFGLDIVRRFKSELGLQNDPRMMDRAEAIELLEQEFPRLGLLHYRNLYDPTDVISDMLSAVSRAKDEVVDEKEYARLAEAMLRTASNQDEKVAAEKAMEVARVYAVYERLKREANCVDFGDLLGMPVRLLEGNSEARVFMQGQYDHILVDEYQDVNRSSVRLLQGLSKTGDNLWVVGDAKQSIYRFRGASSFNVARFGKQDFVGGQRGDLDINYRSCSEIVDTFSQFAVQMEAGGKNATLHGYAGPNGFAPELRTVDHADAMSAALAESIEAMRDAGLAYRDQAVLCRGNEKLAKLAIELGQLGIPVLFLGSLFERPEIKDLVALLSLLVDKRAMGLVRVACWQPQTLRLPDVAAVLDHLRDIDTAPAVWLSEPSSIPGVSSEGATHLGALAAILDGFSRDSLPWPTLATVLLDRTRLAAQIAASGEVAERTRGIAIWQFMNFVSTQPAGRGLPITRLMDRIRRLVRLSDERDLRQIPVAAQGIDAVRLMTMHGAKGLEFPAVHIPGMNADSMPGSPQRQNCPPPIGMVEDAVGSAAQSHQAEHALEQECLFYVALSRAQGRLYMYAPTQKKGGYARKLSPFLDRLGAGIKRSHVKPQRELPPSPGSASVLLSIEGQLRFTGAQLALYESCPRRFFYTHILQVGGRRTSTAFMQLHEAVRSVSKSLIAGTVDESNLAERVDNALSAHGLAGHGYVQDYREIALGMVNFFMRVRSGHVPQAPASLTLTLGDEVIVVHPDDLLVRPDGRRTLRRVQTGHRRSGDEGDIGAAAFLMAARQALPDAVVEFVHLADESVVTLEMTPKVLQNRTVQLGECLRSIRAGQFPALESSRRCPNCPAFFICGPTPPGVLPKNY